MNSEVFIMHISVPPNWTHFVVGGNVLGNMIYFEAIMFSLTKTPDSIFGFFHFIQSKNSIDLFFRNEFS